MLIRRPDEIPGTPMQMEGVKDVTMRLLIGREHGAPNFAMRHFTVEPGGHTPHHRHNYEHELMILDGEGEAEADGSVRRIRAGDFLYMPANAVHQFRNTGSTPLRFVCLVPVSFDCGDGARAPTPGS